MQYVIYTDASVRVEDNVFTTAYFIRTKYDYITMNVIKHVGNNIGVAESLAIGLAAEYMVKNIPLSSSDTVVIKSDSYFSVEWFNKKSNKPLNSVSYIDVRLEGALNAFQMLSTRVKTRLSKIAGHDEVNLTANSIADRLASKLIKIL